MRSSSLQSVFEFFTIPMTFDFRIQTPYEGWTSSLEQGSLSLPRYPHRGAVLNEKNAVIDIITQRDLISFLKRKKGTDQAG